MKKTIMTLATLVALGTTSVFAFGGGQCQGMNGMNPSQCMNMGGGKMHGGQGMMGMPFLDKLNLSDEQRHQFSVLHQEMKLEMAKLRDPKMMTKMQELMTAESFDKKAFIKLTNEHHDKMVALRADHMEKVFNILTKEQRSELKTLMAQKPQKQTPPASK